MKPFPASLSAKLILAAGGTIALILAGAITLSSLATTSRIESMVLDQAKTEAEAVSNSIGIGLAQSTATASTMTGTIAALHSVGLRDRQAYVELLKPAIGSYPNIFGSWIAEAPGGIDGTTDPNAVGANGTGVFTPYWTKTAGGPPKYSTFTAKYDADWYKIPVATGKGYLTAPYLSETGVLMSSVGFPVVADGKLVGVAGIDIGMNDLAESVALLKPFGSGRALLVSGDGNWLVAPDAQLRTKPYEDVGASELVKAVADMQPHVLGTLPDGAMRLVLPFKVTGFDTVWATLIDVPAAVVTGPVNEQLTLLLGGGVVLLLAVLGALAATARFVIRKPMQRLLDDVEHLSAGDYGQPVEGQDSRDEIGALAVSLEGFRHALASGRHAEAVAAQERVKAEAARVETETERQTSAAVQARVVQALGANLARLSSGDLTCSLSNEITGSYGQIREDFNSAVGTLQSTIRSVMESVASIDTGTGEISHAAQEMARRIEGQAASLEETSAALGEITARVNQSASFASSAATTVKSACRDAQASDEVVRQAIEAMRAIERSSSQIGKIIGVIDEIAFQTNLLALNAGVEAARAGEAGRGFAVVATEVRGLAQRSADAARQIKDLISNASREVEEGVDFVERAGESLKKIAAQVLEIDEKVVAIARGAGEQSTGIKEINTAVGHIDQVTQQNAAMLEEAAAAAEALRNEAGELRSLVSHFDTGNTAVSAPVRTNRRAA
ncbi:methyl-accepting chemotaxis protein [Aureimonas sp. ME7]|uniref:methyl-accepting chemotaxis protein n=1 Tax=Aureimonas sp. ME7 TaxID=2744252 RepID=UPI0015F6C3B9|nr:methyl-accepting chemotaxis protein [Aureimonas sp. ME7]